MFAPERLDEVSLFVVEKDLEAVTATLMHERALHPGAHEGDNWTPAAKWSDLADVYRGLDARLARVATALGIAAPPPTDDLGVRPASHRLDLEGETARLETRVGAWEDEARRTRDTIAELEAARDQLQVLLPLEVPVEELRRLRHHHLTIGSLPNENVQRVAAALFQVAFVLLTLERRGDRTVVAVATAREDAHVLDRALRSAFFEPLDLPHGVHGPPPEAHARVQQALDETRGRWHALEARRRTLHGEVGPAVAAARARVHVAIEMCDAMRRFPCREGVYVIAGWMPASRLEPMRQRIQEAATEPVVIETLPPARGRRDVPTLLRNPPWLRPFEPLVTTFGLAGYDEINPTLIAAVTFLFMYGMMFGDIGHGVLLALVGLLLRRWTGFGTVIAAAGASAALFGALYGVAFGITVMEPLWLQPLHAIFPLLIAAVAAGAVILNLGFVLNLVAAFRNRDWPRFWLDKSGVLGIALYWALLGGGLAAFSGLVGQGAWLLVVAVLAALMWFREPLAARMEGGRANVGAHALTGFFELFEAAIAYLSNSLSFVRLGAFAVAHEGLSSMVLQYSAGPTGWITFVLGTALIVGFEGAIVGIQALRLQYYEFFGRFFQGRGRPFHPLAFEGGPDAALPLRP